MTPRRGDLIIRDRWIGGMLKWLSSTEFPVTAARMSSSILSRLDINVPQVLAISLGIVFIFYRLLIYDPRRKHLPKGPRGWPIVGNTFQFSMTDNPEPQLIKWSKEYGEIYYLRLGASDFIFLNSGRVVKDLLDKRGNIYSDKPRLPMAGEAYTKGLNLALMRYDQRWKVSSTPEIDLIRVLRLIDD